MRRCDLYRKAACVLMIVLALGLDTVCLPARGHVPPAASVCKGGLLGRGRLLPRLRSPWAAGSLDSRHASAGGDLVQCCCKEQGRYFCDCPAYYVRWMRLRGGAAEDDDDESLDPDFEPVEKSGSGEGTSSAENLQASGVDADVDADRDAGGDSDILDDSSEGDPTDDAVLDGGEREEGDVLSLGRGDGKGEVDEDVVSEEEEEEEEEEEDDDIEDEDEREGVEEAVEEEVEESIPEEEKGEAREARLMAQKLKNRTDLREERLKQIVKRYEARERRKGEDKRKARQRHQAQLELFLGILPPLPPKTLHQLVACDRGALAEPRQEERAQGAARLVLNDVDRVVVDKEAQVSLADAVQDLRAGQEIEIRLGSYRWSGAVTVGVLALSGPRSLCIRGAPGSELASLPNGRTVPLGPRLVGRWEIERDTVGNMSGMTLMYNASGSPGVTATCAPRFARTQPQLPLSAHSAGDSCAHDGMDLDTSSSGVDGCRVGQGKAGGGAGQDGPADDGQERWPVFEFGGEDVEYLKKEGRDWMLPLLGSIQLGKDGSGQVRPPRPRTVREALGALCDGGQVASSHEHAFAAEKHESKQIDAATVISRQACPDPEADARDISDVTINIESAFWDLTRCQVRSAGGHALVLHGESRVCIASSKLGGSGTRPDAMARIALTCVDASECALRDCVVELCDSGAAAALHGAVVGLEACSLERCKVGLHLADEAQAGMVGCSASDISWGLVFVPEGGLLGMQLNQTCLCLCDCRIEGCDLFVGFGRSGDTDIQNTTITGEIDTIEVLRKTRTRLEGLGSPGQSAQAQATGPDEYTREQLVAMHTEMVLECLAQANRMRAHVSAAYGATALGAAVKDGHQG